MHLFGPSKTRVPKLSPNTAFLARKRAFRTFLPPRRRATSAPSASAPRRWCCCCPPRPSASCRPRSHPGPPVLSPDPLSPPLRTGARDVFNVGPRVGKGWEPIGHPPDEGTPRVGVLWVPATGRLAVISFFFPARSVDKILAQN